MNNEFANEVYLKVDLDRTPILTPENALELLMNGHKLADQLKFAYSYIDKPQEGSMYFVNVLGNDLPHDGYQYMDEEQIQSQPLGDGRIFMISSRIQGFLPGEQFTHVIRRRFRIGNVGRDNLSLIHYSRADESQAVVADSRRAKTPARHYPLKQLPPMIPGNPVVPFQPQQITPQQQQQQAMQAQQQAMQAQQHQFRPQFVPQQAPSPMKSPQGFNTPKMAHPYNGSPVAAGSPSPQQGGMGRFGTPSAPIGGIPQPQAPIANQRLSSVNGPNNYGNQRSSGHHESKRPSSKKQQQQMQHFQQQQQQQLQQQNAQLAQAQQQEEADEPSGDELDFLTAKDVAVARYKRNHDYVAEIFSPYPTAAIIPFQHEFERSLEFLKEQSALYSGDLDELQQEHDAKIAKFKAEAQVVYKGLEGLKTATSYQELQVANLIVETYKDMSVQSYKRFRAVALPLDESTMIPEPKPKPVPVPIPVAIPAPVAAPAPVEAPQPAPILAPTAESAQDTTQVPVGVPAQDTLMEVAVASVLSEPVVSSEAVSTTLVIPAAVPVPAPETIAAPEVEMASAEVITAPEAIAAPDVVMATEIVMATEVLAAPEPVAAPDVEMGVGSNVDVDIVAAAAAGTSEPAFTAPEIVSIQEQITREVVMTEAPSGQTAVVEQTVVVAEQHTFAPEVAIPAPVAPAAIGTPPATAPISLPPTVAEAPAFEAVPEVPAPVAVDAPAEPTPEIVAAAPVIEEAVVAAAAVGDAPPAVAAAPLAEVFTAETVVPVVAPAPEVPSFTEATPSEISTSPVFDQGTVFSAQITEEVPASVPGAPAETDTTTATVIEQPAPSSAEPTHEHTGAAFPQ